MAIRAAWSPETMDLFTAALGRDPHRRFLVVERLPDGGWDWVTWHRDHTGILQHGIADTAAEAMADAERAAGLLAAGHGFFSPRNEGSLQSVQRRPS